MKKLKGARIPVSELDRHTHICDLVFFEEPLASLYKGHNSNWIYLWCDTNGENTDRWLVFDVSRSNLVGYFQRRVTMRTLLEQASQIVALDKTAQLEEGASIVTFHRTAHRAELLELDEYMPTEDSFFDESLTTDIAATREIAPAVFAVPVDGNWFLPDLTRFSKSYTNLYSFFYCTAPRFVSSLQEKIAKYMKSPWKGGYSRVNLFEAMHKQIPSVHEMRVAKYQYASPGQIEIEALESVGAGIKNAVLAYVRHKDEVIAAQKAIDATLGIAKVRKSNLSAFSDTDLLRDMLEAHFLTVQRKIDEVAELLSLQAEFDLLKGSSPNSIVVAKAVLAFLRQLGIVAEYQAAGMLDLNRAAVAPGQAAATSTAVV